VQEQRQGGRPHDHGFGIFAAALKLQSPRKNEVDANNVLMYIKVLAEQIEGNRAGA
jgi:hypothetical protein